MLKWIFGRLERGRWRRDLERFLVNLIGLNGLEAGMVAFNAALARNMVEKNAAGLGFSPGASLLHPREFVEHASDNAARLEFMLREVRGKEQMAFVAGLMPWVHTVRAVRNPAMRDMAVQMWREIARGFEQVPALAESAKAKQADIEGFFKIPEEFTS